MKNRIQTWSNNLVNIFLCTLLSISILGAAQLILPNFIQLKASGINFVCLLVFFFILCYLAKNQVKLVFGKLKIIFELHSRFILLTLAALILVWQFWVIYSLNGLTTWDPAGMLHRVMDQRMNFSAKEYISVYPNNFFLFIFEKKLWLSLHKPSITNFTLILSTINIIFVDLSTYLCGSAIKRHFTGRISNSYFCFALIFIILSPWIAVPYSDILGVCLSSLSVYVTINLFYAKHNWRKVIYSLLAGVFFTLSYLVKPSLVIFYIGCLIVGLVMLVARKASINFLSGIIMLITVVILLSSFSIYKKNNPYVNIDDNKTFSLFHFAAMGIHEKGGWNAQDFNADHKIKTPEKRNKRDIKTFETRLRDFKRPANYIRFLTEKQTTNTADGSFTWAYSGNVRLFQQKNDLPQIIFAAKGQKPKNKPYYFVIQVLWTVSLFCILFTLSNKRFYIQILKYTVVGFFLFLLLFEGGRSRYLIQALPFILTLASIGANQLFLQYRHYKYES